MTRKRVGQGLLEAFSENCEVCKGRGLIIHHEPIPEKRVSGGGSGQAKATPAKAEEPSENGRGGRRRRKTAVAAEPVSEATVEPDATVEPGAEIEAEAAADAEAAVADSGSDDDLDGHEAALAGLDPVPAIGFDEDGLDAEEEPVGARRRGRRRRG
jgi:ribonuclease E